MLGGMLWGMTPPQKRPLHVPGGEVIAQGPDTGLEEDFPVVCPGLSFSAPHTYTAKLPKEQMVFVPKL